MREKGGFVIIGRSGETMWDRLAGMFNDLIDRTLLSCQRVGDFVNSPCWFHPQAAIY